MNSLHAKRLTARKFCLEVTLQNAAHWPRLVPHLLHVLSVRVQFGVQLLGRFGFALLPAGTSAATAAALIRLAVSSTAAATLAPSRGPWGTWSGSVTGTAEAGYPRHGNFRRGQLYAHWPTVQGHSVVLLHGLDGVRAAFKDDVGRT